MALKMTPPALHTTDTRLLSNLVKDQSHEYDHTLKSSLNQPIEKTPEGAVDSCDFERILSPDSNILSATIAREQESKNDSRFDLPLQMPDSQDDMLA